jgi:hypothetical protein
MHKKILKNKNKIENVYMLRRIRKLETTTKVKEQQNKERTVMKEAGRRDAKEGGDGTTELKDGLGLTSLCFCVCHFPSSLTYYLYFQSDFFFQGKRFCPRNLIFVGIIGFFGLIGFFGFRVLY